MKPSLAATVVVGALLLCGCRGDFGLRCENPERYAGEEERAPVRIPDDLSVPDESEALRIPPAGDETQPSAGASPCLESPPDYYEGLEDGADGTAPSETS